MPAGYKSQRCVMSRSCFGAKLRGRDQSSLWFIPLAILLLTSWLMPSWGCCISSQSYQGCIVVHIHLSIFISILYIFFFFIRLYQTMISVIMHCLCVCCHVVIQCCRFLFGWRWRPPRNWRQLATVSILNNSGFPLAILAALVQTVPHWFASPRPVYVSQVVLSHNQDGSSMELVTVMPDGFCHHSGTNGSFFVFF